MHSPVSSSVDSDLESELVQQSIHTGDLHTLLLTAYESLGYDKFQVLPTSHSLFQIINDVCSAGGFKCYEITEEEADDLFLDSMNFSECYLTVKEYLLAAAKSYLHSEE
jgi:hypothetical protein